METRFFFEEPQTVIGKWLSSWGSQLEPKTRQRLFGATFVELAPILLGGSNALAVTITAWMRLGDLQLASIALFDAILLIFRVALTLRGRRPGMAPDLLLFCGILWCILQFATIAIVLNSGDAVMSIILLASSLGTISGIVGRNYPAPRYAMIQIVILFGGYEISLAWSSPQFTPLLAIQFAILVFSNLALLKTMRRNAIQAIESEFSSSAQANSDPLTNLLNRRGFEMAYDEKLPSSGTMVLFYLDLDGFKPVNDEFGHSMGDKILQGVAGRLESVVAGRGLIGRIGGDEFVVLCQVGGIDESRSVGAHIVAEISVPFVLEDQTIAQVGVSVGGLILPDARMSLGHSLRLADQALYCAKSSGKGRCIIAPPQPPIDSAIPSS